MANKFLNFFETLTPEILSPKDYIDWNNVKEKIKEIRREIALLESLDKDNPKEDLADLLNKNPKILKVLQLLIAHTPDVIYFDDENKYVNFEKDILIVEKNKERAYQIAQIFIEMGLVEFLKEVKSIEDVIKGVLLGLEPNVRKNRRGKKLELIINLLIKDVVEEIKDDLHINLSYQSQMFVDLPNERKQIDYVVLKNNVPKVAIEVNFYSTSGSKPSEVLERAYPNLQSNLKNKNIGFIAITDGLGWEKMKKVIKTAFNKIDYLLNIKQAKSGLLKKYILELINKP
jgi:type II restriction enzyme